MLKKGGINALKFSET